MSTLSTIIPAVLKWESGGDIPYRSRTGSCVLALYILYGYSMTAVCWPHQKTLIYQPGEAACVPLCSFPIYRQRAQFNTFPLFGWAFWFAASIRSRRLPCEKLARQSEKRKRNFDGSADKSAQIRTVSKERGGGDCDIIYIRMFWTWKQPMVYISVLCFSYFHIFFLILIFHPISISDSSGLHEAQHDYLLTSRLVPRNWLFLRLRSLDVENMAVSSRTV